MPGTLVRELLLARTWSGTLSRVLRRMKESLGFRGPSLVWTSSGMLLRDLPKCSRRALTPMRDMRFSCGAGPQAPAQSHRPDPPTCSRGWCVLDRVGAAECFLRRGRRMCDRVAGSAVHDGFGAGCGAGRIAAGTVAPSSQRPGLGGFGCSRIAARIVAAGLVLCRFPGSVDFDWRRLRLGRLVGMASTGGHQAPPTAVRGLWV